MRKTEYLIFLLIVAILTISFSLAQNVPGEQCSIKGNEEGDDFKDYWDPDCAIATDSDGDRVADKFEIVTPDKDIYPAGRFTVCSAEYTFLRYKLKDADGRVFFKSALGWRYKNEWTWHKLKRYPMPCLDNCVEVENPNQEDRDEDEKGDACDEICNNGKDDDKDGMIDIYDNDDCSTCIDDDNDNACDDPFEVLVDEDNVYKSDSITIICSSEEDEGVFPIAQQIFRQDGNVFFYSRLLEWNYRGSKEDIKKKSYPYPCVDNCPETKNENQRDSNGDLIGDSCQDECRIAKYTNKELEKGKDKDECGGFCVDDDKDTVCEFLEVDQAALDKLTVDAPDYSRFGIKEDDKIRIETVCSSRYKEGDPSIREFYKDGKLMFSKKSQDWYIDDPTVRYNAEKYPIPCLDNCHKEGNSEQIDADGNLIGDEGCDDGSGYHDVYGFDKDKDTIIFVSSQEVPWNFLDKNSGIDADEICKESAFGSPYPGLSLNKDLFVPVYYISTDTTWRGIDSFYGNLLDIEQIYGIRRRSAYTYDLEADDLVPIMDGDEPYKIPGILLEYLEKPAVDHKNMISDFFASINMPDGTAPATKVWLGRDGLNCDDWGRRDIAGGGAAIYNPSFGMLAAAPCSGSGHILCVLDYDELSFITEGIDTDDMIPS